MPKKPVTIVTKYELMRLFLQDEVAWQGGPESAFKCDGIAAAYLFDRLAFLAANAPQSQIEDVIAQFTQSDG